MKAKDFLTKSIEVMEERGKTYDNSKEERSMESAVKAFNAITKKDLTESEGWLFMLLLKQVRQWSNPNDYHHDSALDSVAYSSLLAESLKKKGKKIEELINEVDKCN